jgi:hypothetical protein
LDLPAAEQARLLRLMASKTLVHEGDTRQVAGWLRRARASNRFDVRAVTMSALYAMSPALCRWVLRLKTSRQGDPRLFRPFADIAAGWSNRRNGPAAGQASPSLPWAGEVGKPIGAEK